MKLVKRTVYLPVNGEQDKVVCNDYPDWMDRITGVLEQEGYFFTKEELNEYTQNVIKQALETAADKAQLYRQNSAYKHSKFNLKIEKCLNYNVGIDLETITNTFEETFKKFEI